MKLRGILEAHLVRRTSPEIPTDGTPLHRSKKGALNPGKKKSPILHPKPYPHCFLIVNRSQTRNRTLIILFCPHPYTFPHLIYFFIRTFTSTRNCNLNCTLLSHTSRKNLYTVYQKVESPMLFFNEIVKTKFLKKIYYLAFIIISTYLWTIINGPMLNFYQK